MNVHRLALGAAQFGMHYGITNDSGQVSVDETKAILDLANMNQIDTIDTAIAYGDSETRLGDIGVENFRVVTKLPPIPEDVPDVEGWIGDQVDASLRRLKIRASYGLLLHRSRDFDAAAVRSALSCLKTSGKVQKIGISIYSPDELDKLSILGEVDIVQAPLNLVDRRLVTSGWLDTLHRCGIEVHARSAFLQGLLVLPITSIPDHFSKWIWIWSAWHDWLSKSNLTAVEVCIAFALSMKVDRVVVGVETVHQLSQLSQAARLDMNIDFPDIASTEEKLINPSLWPSL